MKQIVFSTVKNLPIQHHKSLVFFLFVVILFSSCVSNKQVTYMQYGDEVVSPSEIALDSVIRRYETGELRYTLQADDILNIKIASITPEEYNPFAIADRYLTAGGVGGAQGVMAASSAIGYRIDPTGYINLPVVGRIRAAGFTLDQLEVVLDSMIAVELEDPVTKVNLLNFKFTVLGEVLGEGIYNSPENYLTLMQAIATAGGSDEYADLEHVKVIRKIGNETFVFYVNLLDESFLTSDFYYVFPNDLIVIPPLKSRVYFKYITPNISIISSVLSLAASMVALIVVFGGNSGG